MRYQNVTNNRQFKAITGKSKKEFQELLKTFIEVHEDFFGKLPDNMKTGPTENKLKTYGDCLLFVLYQLKTNLTYDALGATFNMGRSTAFTNFTKFLKVLEISLRREGVLPKREFKTKNELNEALKKEKEIIIDGEEQPIQRPKDPELQKDKYSGKKNFIPTKR